MVIRMYNNQYYQPQMVRYPQIDQYYQPTPQVPKTTGLNGKSVDSLEVVKSMDIPLDGSISYFPLADGSSIVTKQLLSDGTSKVVVYKKTEMEGEPKFITEERLKEELEELKLELKDIKKSLKRKED